VAGVTRNAWAVWASDQPRAALTSRMAMRSVGQNDANGSEVVSVAKHEISVYECGLVFHPFTTSISSFIRRPHPPRRIFITLIFLTPPSVSRVSTPAIFQDQRLRVWISAPPIHNLDFVIHSSPPSATSYFHYPDLPYSPLESLCLRHAFCRARRKSFLLSLARLVAPGLPHHVTTDKISRRGRDTGFPAPPARIRPFPERAPCVKGLPAYFWLGYLLHTGLRCFLSRIVPVW
jgi:hypothetical protein